MRTWVTRVLSWLAAALIGGVYGVAGTIAHSLMWGPIPVGIIVGAIGCTAILIAIRALTRDRGAVLAAGIGMMGLLMIISGRGPGGSVVVPDTVAGQVWIYLLAGIALLVIAWPRFSHLPVRTLAPQSDAAAESQPVITEVPRAEAAGPDRT